MRRQPILFGRKSDQAKSKFISAERLLNCYADLEGRDARGEIVLYGTPGLTLLASIGTSPVRGMHDMAGVLYAVIGTTLYSVGRSGTYTSLGTVPGSDYVSMADNGTQLCIVNNPDGFIYDRNTTVFGQITDPDWFGASHVVFADNYFVFSKPESGIFFISALLDGYDIDALDFATAEAHPDNLVGLAWDHRQLVAFGEKSIQVYYNSGNASFPFTALQEIYIDRGCISGFSIVQEDNTVFWVGEDKIIYRLDGTSPRRISNRAVERAIGKVASPEKIISCTYTEGGHKFIIFDLNGAATWVYDISTDAWHERESYEQGYWQGRFIVNVYGKKVVGSSLSGKLYELDENSYTENGSMLVREVISPPLHVFPESTTATELWFDFETGEGQTTGQGSDPVAMLAISNDGGKTYGSEIMTSMGKLGQRDTRVVFRRLGQAYGRTARLRVSDPVPFALAGAYAAWEQDVL